ncbi:MAG: polymerase protein [Paenibacillus sp.]|jgi:bifunctional non-homologous end joining protein LigD|nr:polymerase protein [Paenibacillus sp.]
MGELVTEVEGTLISISDPDVMLWPGITKLDYINYLLTVSPYMLPYTRDRMLMIWRYPEGIGGARVEERSIHGAAPDWVPREVYNGKERILLNNVSTLVWAANLGAIEFHVPFDKYYRKDYPTELVFDLDPPDDRSFTLVLEVALKVKEVLDSLSLASVPKTSGATGLQIFVPIAANYTFEETRQINKFIGHYILQKMPEKITLDRVIERRGKKLYFDYLQLWRGRTMIAPYSVRAQPRATVSTPVMWEEVHRGFVLADFSIKSIPARIAKVGDLFHPISQDHSRLNQILDNILAFLRTHK